MINNIRECIELGMSYSATAGAIQVTPESFNNWMQWGKTGQKDPIYTQLYSAVREAESKLMYDCLFKLRKSAETGNIESVKWLLERRFPQEYGKQNSLNVKSENVNLNLNATPTVSEAEKIRQDILSKLAPRKNITPQPEQLTE